jgi:GNAT superfamily N-acetyltransferase
MAKIRVSPATVHDVPVLLDLIRQLAEYEKLSSEVSATEAKLRSSLFGPKPVAEALIAYIGNEPIGFALFFQTFSTFLAKPSLYLEDLFVVPQRRRRGCGRLLLEHLAGLAVERGCGRFEWAVLDWNTPALDFYRSLGARVMDEWKICRLTGDALLRLGTRAASGSGRTQ